MSPAEKVTPNPKPAAHPRVATLGGPGTFAHQGAEHILQRYPELGTSLTYRPSVDDLWSALEDGEIDTVILSEQTSLMGWGAVDERVAPPGSGLFVHSATTVAYHCSLYAKEGTRLSDIEGIYGHGSIHQCRPWLDANLPGVPTLVHEQNSVAAAREVAESDGRRAVVSTRLTGESAGLVALATDIDGGALGSWWAVATRPWFAATPDRTIISVRAGEGGELNDTVAAVADLGGRLITAYSLATRRQLFEYDYLLAFAGRTSLEAITAALRAVPAARLVGAYCEAGFRPGGGNP
jgi:chorismate mutase / prephenate dehydratase